MSHWVSGIGYQVTLLTLKSPDLEMQCARMCEKQDESLDPFSVPSFPRSVLCRRPRRNCFRAATNRRVTEAQQQGRIGGRTGAHDGLSSQKAWVLGCWGWGWEGAGLDWFLFVSVSSSLPKDSVPLKVTTLYGTELSLRRMSENTMT